MLVFLIFGVKIRKRPRPFFSYPLPDHDRRNGITDSEEVKQTLLHLILRQLRVMNVKDLQAAYDQVSLISEARHGVSRMRDTYKR